MLHKAARNPTKCEVMCFFVFAIPACILRIQALITNILFENRKRKVFKIFEQLP